MMKENDLGTRLPHPPSTRESSAHIKNTMHLRTLKLKSHLIGLGLTLLAATATLGAAESAGKPAADAAMAFPWQVPKLITEEWDYRGPAGVARDAGGRILVVDEFNDQIQVFAPDGKPLMVFGGPGKGDGRFDRPAGITVDAKGDIYVVDSGNDRIQKFYSKGGFIAKWGGPGNGDGQFCRPQAIAVDATGNIYVTDTLNYRVQVLGPDGRFRAKWGTQGDGPGQFGWPNGIAVDGRGTVWVSDSRNNRLLGFDSAGKPMMTIGRANGADLDWPAGVAVDKDGMVYVADSQHRRIKIFSPEGKLQRALGSDGVEGVRFEFPHSLAVSPAGDTLCGTDWTGNRLQVLDAQGADKGAWKVTAEGRFNTPEQIVIDRNGTIHVTDRERSEISILDPRGHELVAFGGPAVARVPGNFRFKHEVPYAVALDPAGNIYVAEKSLTVYDNKGRYLKEITLKNKGTARGVIIDSKGAMMVLEKSGLVKYAPDGTLVGDLPLTGAEIKQMNQIGQITGDRQDNIYVLQTSGNNRVLKFDAAGKYVAELQRVDKTSIWKRFQPAGEFFYTVDPSRCEIQKVAADGSLLKKWGGKGTGAGEFGDSIGDIAVAPDGSVYATDPGNHRVQVFSPEGLFLKQIGRYADYPNNGADHRQYRNRIPAATSEPVVAGERSKAYFNQTPPDQLYRDRFASDLELLAKLERGLGASPAAEAGADYVRLIRHCLNVKGSPDTCADLARILDAVGQSLQRARGALPPESPLAAELRRLQQAELEQAVRCLAARRASLGNCAVWIAGKQLGAATHAIVTPDQPTPSEERAALELRNYLEQMTGQDLPILRDAAADPASRSLLLIGRSNLLPKLGVMVDWEKLGPDGIALNSAGAHLVLAGGQRGALYAVYTFLEDQLGCHWYTPDCTVVPASGERRVEKLALTHVPTFQLRDQASFLAMMDPDWAVRNKYFGESPMYNDARGGTFRFFPGMGHTFYKAVPPEKYFKEHPEYFSMIKGKREAGRNAQLCLSNPEVENIMVRYLEENLRLYPWYKIVSVAQEDWKGYCECPQCAAVDAEEGGPSGSIIRFVNRVAERIEKTHPDVLVHTFAYQYSRHVPRLARPRDNMVIQLCSIECNQGRPLGDPADKLNAPFAKDLEEWAKVSKHLYIWDYAADFQRQWLQPNLWNVKPNLQLFAAHNVRGVRLQQQYMATHEMQEERTWLLAKLIWNPAADDKALLDEFLKAYYGPAAGPLARYYQQAHDYVQQHNITLGIGFNRRKDAFPMDELMRYEALFAEATAAAKGDVTILRRVEKARLPVLAARIILEKELTTKAKLLDWYERVAKREGMTQWREKYDGPSLGAWLAEQRQNSGSEPKSIQNEEATP